MRKILILLLFLCSGSLFAQAGEIDTLIVKTKIYCDHCKECSTCQPHIERELNFAKGVKSFKVDVAREEIMIIYSTAKTTPAAIRNAIANGGYDADEIPANQKAVARLDGCCQKK
jgi:copper chaperone CopZ